MTHLIQLLAQTDGEILRTIKEPGFAQFIVYALVLVMIGDKIYGWVMRGKAAKMEVTGDVTASEKPQYVTMPVFEKLVTKVDELGTKNDNQHNVTIQAGERRMADLSTAMDRETTAITGQINGLQKDIHEQVRHGFERVTDKLSDMGNHVASQGSKLEAMDQRISELTERYTASIGRIHERVDDAVNASTVAASSAAAAATAVVNFAANNGTNKG